MSSEKPKYKKGDAQSGAPVDLNSINFKNKDIDRWSAKTTRKNRNTNSGSRLVGIKGYGGTKTSRI